MKRLLPVLLLCSACGGESFTNSELVGATDPGFDGGPGGATTSGAGGASSGAGGVTGTGGALGAGGSVPVCLTDLSGVGTGNFSIHFTLTTTESVRTLGLLSQRVGCDDTSTFWDVTLGPTGGVTASTSDGVHHVVVEAGNSLNDGKPHRVDIVRHDGEFWYASDGAINSAPTPDPYAFGVFPPLVLGSSACAWASSASGHATISNVCLELK